MNQGLGDLAKMKEQIGAVGPTAAASVLLPLEIGQRVIVTDERPYREASIIAVASRYFSEYVKVRYDKAHWFRRREEWVYYINVAPIRESKGEGK